MVGVGVWVGVSVGVMVAVAVGVGEGPSVAVSVTVGVLVAVGVGGKCKCGGWRIIWRGGIGVNNRRSGGEIARNLNAFNDRPRVRVFDLHAGHDTN